MTDIEQKALALVNEVAGIGCYALCDAHPINLIEALCRAIEQIEDLRQSAQIDAADSARLEYEIAQDIIRCLCPEPDAWPGTNGVKAMARKLVPLRQPTQSDALRAALEALEGMVKYSGMRESWQDDNPQYVVAAYDAIDVINAALQEQSK